jgi:alpha-1,3-rhamnosyltransferase
MRGNEPLVSVIMPTYNHEKFVEEAIRSVMAETYQNIELIVIDDGSKDDTYQKVLALKEECEKRFVRVVTEKQENQGTSVTCNRLVNMAEGKYVCLLASDDKVKPDKMAAEVQFLEAHPDYVLVTGDNEFIDAQSQVVGCDDHCNPVPLNEAKYKTFGEYLKAKYDFVNFNSDEFGSYETLAKTNYIPNGCMWRMDAIKKSGGWTNEALLEDWYINMQLAKLGRMKYLDKVLFCYRQHGANTFQRRDHMRKITYRARVREQKLVNLPENACFKAAFEAANLYQEMKFNCCGVKVYKEVDLAHKKKVLEIFGKKFVLSQKPR